MYKFKCEVLATQAREHITYHEASEKVSSRFVLPQRTYRDAVTSLPNADANRHNNNNNNSHEKTIQMNLNNATNQTERNETSTSYENNNQKVNNYTNISSPNIASATVENEPVIDEGSPNVTQETCKSTERVEATLIADNVERTTEDKITQKIFQN